MFHVDEPSTVLDAPGVSERNCQKLLLFHSEEKNEVQTAAILREMGRDSQ